MNTTRHTQQTTNKQREYSCDENLTNNKLRWKGSRKKLAASLITNALREEEYRPFYKNNCMQGLKMVENLEKSRNKPKPSILVIHSKIQELRVLTMNSPISMLVQEKKRTNKIKNIEAWLKSAKC